METEVIGTEGEGEGNFRTLLGPDNQQLALNVGNLVTMSIIVTKRGTMKKKRQGSKLRPDPKLSLKRRVKDREKSATQRKKSLVRKMMTSWSCWSKKPSMVS